MAKNEELVELLGDVASEHDEDEIQDDVDENEEDEGDEDEGDDDEEDEGDEDEDDEGEEGTPKGVSVSRGKLPNTQALSVLQKNIDTIIGEEAKIEAKIDAIKEHKKPNMEAFESNLKEYLTEEEWDAKFEDNPMKFLKAVEKARQKYIEEHTDSKEVEDLSTQLEGVKKRKEQYYAIKEVTELYPDFDFNKAVEFFQKKLTGEEVEEIKSKPTVKEGLIAIYKKMKHLPIKRVEAPNKPRADEIKRRSAKGVSVTQREENEAYLKKIGLGR